MDCKIFDIPFLPRTPESDFSCQDGEIESPYGFSPEGENSDSILSEGLKSIEFALVRTILPGWHVNPDIYPVKTLVASDPSMEYWNRLTAQLLRQFKSEADENRLFVAPFYVRAAWKTVSGTYLAASDPVLLTPNTGFPVVTTDGDISDKELDFKVAGAVCSLYFRLPLPEVLREYVGVIRSLDIFVSDPPLKYDSLSLLLPVKHAATDNCCESLDLKTGVVSRERVCTQTLPIGWKAPVTAVPDLPKGLNSAYRRIAALPFEQMAPGDYDEWTAVPSLPRLGEGWGAPASDNSLSEGIKGTDSEIDIITRPLKLSGAGRLKILRRVFLRGDFTPSEITVTVYASRDMLKWWTVSRRKGGTVVSLPPTPFRFFKVRVQGYLAASQSLQALSLESAPSG